MKSQNKVTFNTIILCARMAITVFVSLYTVRLVVGALGEVDYGIFNLVAGTVSMLTFLNTGMSAATQRFMSHAQGQGDAPRIKRVFVVSLAVHFVVSIVVLFVTLIAGYFLFKNILNIDLKRIDVAGYVYVTAAVGAAVSVLSVPYDAVINSRENMIFVAITGVLEAFAKLTIAIILGTAPLDKLLVYGVLTLGLGLIILTIKIIYCHFMYEECTFALSKFYDRRLASEVGSFAGWSFLGSASSLMSHYGQGIVLNKFFGERVNAAQGIANQVSGQLGAVTSVMLKALNPMIAKSEGAGNRFLMLKASVIGSKFGFVMLVPVFVPVMVEMNFVFDFWLGVTPTYAVVFCRLLLVRNLIDQLFSTLPSVIYAVGSIKSYQVYSSILNPIPLLASILMFTFDYPVESIYWSYIAYSLVCSCLLLYFCGRDCGLDVADYFSNVVVRGCFLLFFVYSVALVANFLLDEGVVRLVAVFVSTFFSYALCSWLFVFRKQEKTIIKNQINLILKSFFKQRFIEGKK